MLYPLPAVMVSCALEGEKPNIITVAWAGTVCTNPPMLSISVRKERYSYHIIRESGEFVVNLVTEELLRACDFCGVKSGRDTDKFAETGLTAGPAQSGKLRLAPVIAESPVSIECTVSQVLDLGSHTMFIANVHSVDIDPKYLDSKGRFDLNAAHLVAYSHGEYLALGEKLGSFGYSVKKVGGIAARAIAGGGHPSHSTHDEVGATAHSAKSGRPSHPASSGAKPRKRAGRSKKGNGKAQI